MSDKRIVVLVLLLSILVPLAPSSSPRDVSVAAREAPAPLPADVSTVLPRPDLSAGYANEGLAAAPNWVQITTATSPLEGDKYAMVYDSGRRRTVLYTGAGLWEYDGTNWAPRSTAVSPPARSNFALAYDDARKRVVLFGGSYKNDTWEYDGTNWVQASPTSSPPGRSYHAMAYDSDHDCVVLFGGVNQSGTALGDTWVYDGLTWYLLSMYESPYPRYKHVMAYDSARQRVVLYGGLNLGISTYFGDTWELMGSAGWYKVSVTNAPPHLEDEAMVYDSGRGRMVLFGGNHPISTGNLYNSTWEYDGTNWVQAEPETAPPARTRHAMAYDRNRTVLFGGCNSAGCIGFNVVYYDDTWEYTPAPSNDDFDYAHLIPEPPANGQPTQHLDTDTTDATVAGGDPIMGCGIGTNSNTLWFRLVPTYYGPVQVHTFGSNYNTVLAVYTGSRGALTPITCNDDADGTTQSRVGFDVKPGTTYYIEVASYGSLPGGGVLSLSTKYDISTKAWTLMFYTAADGDLSSRWNGMYDGLADSSIHLGVNVLGFWDGSAPDDTKFTYFSPYGPQDVPKGELSTGAPSTLVTFLDWAMEQYPAQHYALIIADHGHGISGVALDESLSDWLRPKELSSALSDPWVPHLDILYMHACLQGTLDMGYQVRDYVDYYVATESVAGGEIYPKRYILGYGDIPPISTATLPEQLAIAMARTYASTAYPEYAGTISVADLSKVGFVATWASTLAGTIRRVPNFAATLQAINAIHYRTLFLE